jgi:RNA polymerase sigma-70 factor (ECF subfamily)
MTLSYAGGHDPDDRERSSGSALPVGQPRVGLAGAASTDAVDRFRQIHAANYTRLVGYATRRTTSGDDAADVVAETFLVAWKNLAKVPPGDQATPWLFGVARGVLANQRRSERRRFRLARRIGFEMQGSRSSAQPASEPGDLPEVAAAFAELSASDREVLSLTVWEGLSPAELAVALGCSAGAAKVRLSRARGRLQRSIERRQVTWRSDGR